MKKSLLFISMLVAGATTGFAQKSASVPNALLDTTATAPTFLPSDTIVMVQTMGGSFSQVFSVYIPTNLSMPISLQGQSQTVTASLDSVHIDSISGVPPGFTLTCGTPSCMVKGGQKGCFTLTGTMPMTNNILYKLGVMITPYGQLTGQFASFAQLAGISSALPDALALVGAMPAAATYKVEVGTPVITGIQDFSLNGAFNVNQNIPNPFDGSTAINFNAAGNGNINFIVTDILGRQVYDTNINASVGANTFVFTTDLANGSYFFSLSDGKNTITKKMVINK